MFSVKTENILLNYFVVLFAIGFISIYLSSNLYLIIFFLLVLSGILLYFDRFFFFKLSFLIILMGSIVSTLLIKEINIFLLVLLFISLSQVCLLTAYLLFFVFLGSHSQMFEAYLIVLIFFITLALTYLFGHRRVKKDFRKKFYFSETSNRFFRHDLCNLYSVIFLKNKDKSLEPILEEIRASLHSESENSKSSIAGLLRITIFLLDYNYNLSVKSNFFIEGSNLSGVSFFSCLLENFAKTGTTIFIKDNYVLITLRKNVKKDLNNFLSDHFMKENISLEGNVLKFYYGM